MIHSSSYSSSSSCRWISSRLLLLLFELLYIIEYVKCQQDLTGEGNGIGNNGIGSTTFGHGGLEQDPNDVSCPLTCLNDSTCKQGNATFTNEPLDPNGNELDIHEVKNYNGYHCSCLSGFTGVTCGVIYESCADGDLGHICYHGGKCVPGIEDEYGNEQYYCDCTNAIANGNHYAGKYCENVAVTICDSNKHKFCVNDGICKANPSDIEPPCDCGPNFTGAHCEYSKDDVPESCDLKCDNGGQCQLGIPNGNLDAEEQEEALNTSGPDTNGIKNDPEDANSVSWLTHGGKSTFTYCLCPKGFHGTTCQTDQVPCGSDGNYCYHGSQCKESEVIPGQFSCDCNDINTPYESYAGIYCQFEATDYCAASLSFCVNGGTCIDEGGGIFSCDCPIGFHGPKCEFISNTNGGGTSTGHNNGGSHNNFPTNGGSTNAGGSSSSENCDLKCYNQGSCRKGTKDLGDYQHLNINDIPQLNITEAEQSEHCVCPKGYIGNQCEIKIEECGLNIEHICLHGSKCVPAKKNKNDNINTKWTCQCDDAFTTDKKYAGEFCQHHHTMTCTTSDENNNNIYEGIGSTSLAFCVNDGICTEFVENGESHPGCKCPRGYTGIHCELYDKVHPGDYDDSNDNNDDQGLSSVPLRTDQEASASAAIVFVLLLIMIVVGVLTFTIIYRIQEGKRLSITSNHLSNRDDHNAVNESTLMEQVAFTSSQRFEDVELT